MGDMADFYLEQGTSGHDEWGVGHTVRLERVRKLLTEGWWTAKDGTKIRVQDMTDLHLANSLRYFERQPNLGALNALRIQVVENEIARRADSERERLAELKAEGDR